MESDIVEEGFPLFSKGVAFSKRGVQDEEIVTNDKLILEWKRKRQKKGLKRLSERHLGEVLPSSPLIVEANNGSPIERNCHLLSLLLEELGQVVAALHSHKSQSLRLTALNRFKSGQVQVLPATDVASRGLDIPTVDLVINYDLPRYPSDYVHRVGRTARAGSRGLALSFITQNDVDLVHEIETVIGKQLDKFERNEKVYKAKRVATMKMLDDGYKEKGKERKTQKLKRLAERGLLNMEKQKYKLRKI